MVVDYLKSAGKYILSLILKLVVKLIGVVVFIITKLQMLFSYIPIFLMKLMFKIDGLVAKLQE